MPSPWTAAGNAYLTGITTSGKFFPTTTGAFQTKFKGGYDAFVVKLNPNLSGSASLIYSTFLGGSDYEEGQGIAVDGAGDAYVTGYTKSTNFPTMNAYQAYQGGLDAFVTKLNPSGSQLLYSTFLGGSGDESGSGNRPGRHRPGVRDWLHRLDRIPDDGGGLHHKWQRCLRGEAQSEPVRDGFTHLLDLARRQRRVQATQPGSIAVDGSGDAVVAGTSFSGSFPTTAGAFQTVGPGGALRGQAERAGDRGTSSPPISPAAETSPRAAALPWTPPGTST